MTGLRRTCVGGGRWVLKRVGRLYNWRGFLGCGRSGQGVLAEVILEEPRGLLAGGPYVQAELPQPRRRVLLVAVAGEEGEGVAVHVHGQVPGPADAPPGVMAFLPVALLDHRVR